MSEEPIPQTPVEDSILGSTKKFLGYEDSYTDFDIDISMFINAGLAVVNDLGVGPSEGLNIQDREVPWSALGLSPHMLAMVKNYLYKKTRLAFDPPQSPQLTTALKESILEDEWRIKERRSSELNPTVPLAEYDETITL